jgi:hypothetical protein
MTAPPPPPPAPKDSKDQNKDSKDQKKDAKGAPLPAPPSPYAFEDFAQIEPRPSAPGQTIRILRGIGLPAGS